MYMQHYLSDRKYHNAEFLIMTGHVIIGAARVGVAFSDIKQQNVKHFAFEPLDYTKNWKWLSASASKNPDPISRIFRVNGTRNQVDTFFSCSSECCTKTGAGQMWMTCGFIFFLSTRNQCNGQGGFCIFISPLNIAGRHQNRKRALPFCVQRRPVEILRH